MSVTTRQLARMSGDFSRMMWVPMSLADCLDTLANRQRNQRLRDALLQVRSTVLEGDSLSHAMSLHPDVFDKNYVAMVRRGELGGNLDVVLAEYARSSSA